MACVCWMRMREVLFSVEIFTERALAHTQEMLQEIWDERGKQLHRDRGTKRRKKRKKNNELRTRWRMFECEWKRMRKSVCSKFVLSSFFIFHAVCFDFTISRLTHSIARFSVASGCEPYELVREKNLILSNGPTFCRSSGMREKKKKKSWVLFFSTTEKSTTATTVYAQAFYTIWKFNAN